LYEPANDRTVIDSVAASIRSRQTFDEPYRHWILSSIFSKPAVDALASLPFPAPDLGGVSGRRELHNDTRRYFDQENIGKFPIVKLIAHAFQEPELTSLISSAFKTDIDGTYLRIEYAQDTGGFWLEPHTDLGVKKFTMLYYLSDDPGHRDLGTDIYRDKDTHFGRAPFVPNTALVFIPSTNTWHGFERRMIPGVRKSVIINYVTNEWRAREQLSWPDQPVVRPS
jgi:hypothetical protein